MLRIIAPPLFEGRPEISISHSFVEELVKLNVPFKYYTEGIFDPVKNGGVYTSPVMAQYYGNTTLQIIKDVGEGDILVWLDAWNPALPLLWHYCAAERLKVSNYGIWHSSPTTPGDYLSWSSWADDFQSHLIDFTDGIFVATQYMKNMILDGYRGRKSVEELDRSVHVTGLPFDHSVIKNNPIKKNKIVYGHRWAEDKRPWNFLNLAESCVESHPALQFQILSPSNIWKEIETTWVHTFKHKTKNVLLPSNTELAIVTKEQYYEELSTAQFVWADSELETFGYFILEGILSGAMPIVNNHPCYEELYGKGVGYGGDQVTTAHEKLLQYLDIRSEIVSNYALEVVLEEKRQHLREITSKSAAKMLSIAYNYAR